MNPYNVIYPNMFNPEPVDELDHFTDCNIFNNDLCNCEEIEDNRKYDAAERKFDMARECY